jgi:hypothetical protein
LDGGDILPKNFCFSTYQFVVCPILLGSGRSLVSGVSKSLRLELLEAKQYQSGDVMLRYARPNEISP